MGAWPIGEYHLTKLKTVASVADVLERELEPTIKERLRRVNLVPELFNIPLSDADRTGHLPKLYFDLISRLRLPKNAHLRCRCRSWASATCAGLLCWNAH
jgi:hypothetical protein